MTKKKFLAHANRKNLIIIGILDETWYNLHNIRWLCWNGSFLRSFFSSHTFILFFRWKSKQWNNDIQHCTEMFLIFTSKFIIKTIFLELDLVKLTTLSVIVSKNCTELYYLKNVNKEFSYSNISWILRTNNIFHFIWKQ